MVDVLRTVWACNARRGENMTNVRTPKDDEECRKARIAVALGMGRSLSDVVEELLGEAPEEAFLDAVRNRIEFAHETNEVLDFKVLIDRMIELQNEHA